MKSATWASSSTHPGQGADGRISEPPGQALFGEAMQAIGLLERLVKAAEAQRRTGSVIEILVAQALAHQVQGNLPLALAILERALTLAQPEGYIRLFVDEGEPSVCSCWIFRRGLKSNRAARAIRCWFM